MSKFKVGDIICSIQSPEKIAEVVSVSNKGYVIKILVNAGWYSVGELKEETVEDIETNGRLVTKLEKALQ